MTVLAPLPPDDGSYEVVIMLTPSRAVDLYLGDLGRRSRSKSGRTAASYARILDKFTDSLRRKGDIDVSDITSDDCRAFLDRYTRRAAGTQANVYSILNSFLGWLDLEQERISRNPLHRVPKPRKIAAEDLDVTSVATADVPKLLAACRSDSERICVAVLAYLGPRRNAVALLRLSDYDAEQRLMRFREKGSKVIRKPVPDELAEILDSAIRRGVYDLYDRRHDAPEGPNSGTPPHASAASDPRGEHGPRLDSGAAGGRDDAADPPSAGSQLPRVAPHHDPYLVPAEGGLVRHGDRDDRVIWRLVKKVGDRAGIDIHVHALRAAFAVHYLETGGDLVGLQELLGHASIETTRIYLRKLDKAKAMEPVRTLSWGPDLSVELLGRLPERTVV